MKGGGVPFKKPPATPRSLAALAAAGFLAPGLNPGFPAVIGERASRAPAAVTSAEAEQAKAKGGKEVQPQHLKPAPSAGGRRAQREASLRPGCRLG